MNVPDQLSGWEAAAGPFVSTVEQFLVLAGIHARLTNTLGSEMLNDLHHLAQELLLGEYRIPELKQCQPLLFRQPYADLQETGGLQFDMSALDKAGHQEPLGVRVPIYDIVSYTGDPTKDIRPIPPFPAELAHQVCSMVSRVMRACELRFLPVGPTLTSLVDDAFYRTIVEVDPLLRQ
jgi:hypothetical protein